MKEVVVHPERCVGCMQCMAACAAAHSHSKNLFLASLEAPRPRSRVHVEVAACIGPANDHDHEVVHRKRTILSLDKTRFQPRYV